MSIVYYRVIHLGKTKRKIVVIKVSVVCIANVNEKEQKSCLDNDIDATVYRYFIWRRVR